MKAEQELEKFERQLRETGLTAEKVGQKLKDAGQKMTDVGKNLTMKVTAPVLAIGAAANKGGHGLRGGDERGWGYIWRNGRRIRSTGSQGKRAWGNY